MIRRTLPYVLLGGLVMGGLAARGEIIDGYEMYIMHPYRNPQTHELLRDWLSAGDFSLRVEALRALAYINDRADTDRISALLEDSDARVRVEALRALAPMGDVPIPAARARALARDAEGPVRRAFFTNLRAFNVSNRETLVKEGLLDAEPEGRAAAGAVAATLPGMQLVLFEALKQEANESVQQSGYKALLQENTDFRKALLQWGTAQGDAFKLLTLDHLQPDDESIRSVVMGWLDHPVAAVAEGAFAALARVRWEAVVPKALSGLSGTGNLRDMTLIQTLGQFERADSRAALSDTAMRNPERLAAVAAIEALTAWKSSDTTAALIPLTASNYLEVRIAATRELGVRRALAAVPTLYGMLHDEPAELLAEVLQALVLIDTPDKANHLERFRELTQSVHGPVKAGAFRLRGQLNDRTQLKDLDRVLNRIKWDDPYEPRLAAWEVLRQWKVNSYYERAIEFVTVMVLPPPPMSLPSYDHDIVRNEAMGYLMDFRRPDTAGVLLDELIEMPSRWLRVKLAGVLSELTGKKYIPLPDHAFKSYRVESLEARTMPTVPIPGVQLVPP